MSSQADIPGLVLNTSVMVAMAVPVAGPEIAGALSIVSALYEGAKKEFPPAYSTAQAIGDLGDQVYKMLKGLTLDDRLAEIRSWQEQAKKISTDIERACDSQFLAIGDNRKTLVQGIEDFHNTKDYDKIFSWFELLKDEDETKNLELYFVARAAYHDCCFLMLQLNALLEGGDVDHYAEIPHSIIDDFYRSLDEAIEYGKSKQEALDHAFKHSVDEATAKSIANYPNPGRERNLDFAQQLIAARRKAHLDCITQPQVDRIAEYLAAFEVTRAYLGPYTAEKVAAVDKAAAAAAWAIVQTAIARDRTAMGKKPAKAVRFLYECTSTGGWVPALSDSPLAPGSSVATQDAGSTLPGIYYKVGGGTLNKVFADALTQSAQLTTVNDKIAVAYDAKYGAGSYKTDSGKSSPRQDRLTSFVIPLAQESPVGDNVYAMVYSVGPQLTSLGIVDRDGYKQIYLDALAGISKWNQDHPKAKIENFRVTMLSTGAFGSPAFMSDSAGLIVQAVKEAAKADASLTGITILVNSNYPSALEPAAFGAAATAAGIKATTAGFDLPLS